MKHVLLALLLAPLLASAQTAPRPACYPLINGHPAGVPRHVVGQYGQHLFWACSDRAGATPKWYGFSCLADACNARALGTAIMTITRASAKVGTAHAQWDQSMSFSCGAPQTPAQAQLCSERAQILRQNAAAWLP